MYIMGIDMSIASPAMVCFELSDNYEILSKDYLGFSNVKKYGCDHIKTYSKDKDFGNCYDRYAYLRDNMFEFIEKYKPSYVALEDYAYAATGHVISLGEVTNLIQMGLYEIYNIPFRKYDISTIKLLSTKNGIADKIKMEEFYEKLDNKIDLSYLPLVSDHKTGNPKDNIVDAFYICDMLRMELLLRSGIKTLKDINNPILTRIMNRVTKSNPVNILDTPFFVKRINE